MEEGETAPAPPPPPETPRAERSKHVKVMEYALNLAMKAKQLTPQQSEVIIALFEEAESQGADRDSFENKIARFEKSLKARFGPKASSIAEIVTERRKETINMIQTRQSRREDGSVVSLSQLSQESQPRPTPPSSMQNMSQMAPPSAGHFQAINQQQQHPSAYMTPSPPTLGGVPPQQQQQAHWQMQGTQSYYQMNQSGGNNSNEHNGPGMTFNNANGGGGGGGNGGGGGMGTLNAPGPGNNPMFNNNNLLLQSMQPRPDMHHNTHGMYGQQQQQNQQQQQYHHNQQQQQQQRQQQVQQAQQAQQQKLLMQQKLKQQMQQKQQQQAYQQQQHHNQQQHGGAGSSSGMSIGSHSSQHKHQQQQQQQQQHQSHGPVELTPAEEIDRETERVKDIQSEGMEFTSDRGLAAPLLPGEFVREERTFQRHAVRSSMQDASMAPSLVAYGVRHVSQNMMVDLTGGGGGGFGGGDLPQRELEPGQEWQVQNILDLPVTMALCRRILGDDRRMSPEAMTVLSQGIQMYLKNMVEQAMRTSKSRSNKASHNSYECLMRMLVEYGKGYVMPENQLNVAMKWGPDIREMLEQEEKEARRIVKEHNVREEEALREDMRLYDEERAKLLSSGGGGGGGGGASKRKAEMEAPWWSLDDAAEKAGTLSFEELSRVHFKLKVAQKYQLGVHMPTKKKLTKAAAREEHMQQQYLQQQQQLHQQQQRQQQKMDVQESERRGDGSSGTSSSSSSSGALADGNQDTSSVINWANQPCPLTPAQKNLITVDDLEHTISHSFFAKSAVAGIGCSLSRDREGVGRHVQRWRLGLDLHQLIEK